MKHFIWIVLVLFVLSLAFLGYLFFSRLDYFNYENNVVEFAATGMQTDVTAKYLDKTVILNNYNFEILCYRFFMITERKTVFKIPVKDTSNKLSITVDEKNYYEIIPSDSNPGSVYILSVINGKVRKFYVSEKYRIFERILDYVGEDGAYGPNTLIE